MIAGSIVSATNSRAFLFCNTIRFFRSAGFLSLPDNLLLTFGRNFTVLCSVINSDRNTCHGGKTERGTPKPDKQPAFFARFFGSIVHLESLCHVAFVEFQTFRNGIVLLIVNVLFHLPLN